MTPSHPFSPGLPIAAPIAQRGQEPPSTFRGGGDPWDCECLNETSVSYTQVERHDALRFCLKQHLQRHPRRGRQDALITSDRHLDRRPISA
jgi:hypothetical protein